MCGIVGVYSLNNKAKGYSNALSKATASLSKRGPDSHGIFIDNKVALGHARLSIIDLTSAGAQPMTDISKRYTIVFNGEIYNYLELRKELLSQGVQFQSESDTEVLLYLYVKEGKNCIDNLNGFFSFAIYDNLESSLFLARDRLGIKPLLLYQDDEKIIFSSEMKAICAFQHNKELDYTSLYTYLQLNYIPAPNTIYKNVKKIEPGCCVNIDINGKVAVEQYYSIPYSPEKLNNNENNYDHSKNRLRKLLFESVEKRMISDVPLGAFLSGGIDSSIIVGIASQLTNQLNTFSIGYTDEPFFDETKYANIVAKKFNTNHTVFSLSNNELFDNLYNILDYIDEPFADSSAIAVYILSQKTRKEVTVALSGDGADELFAGYNKHEAEYRIRHHHIINFLIKSSLPIIDVLPKSRNSFLGNLSRQISRYAEGLKLSESDRYWRWCAFVSENEAKQILLTTNYELSNYIERKENVLSSFNNINDLNETLLTDTKFILSNDMLTKVDWMSMANSLEVRVPFLDHEVVNFAFTLPSNFKIDGGIRKKILKDAFHDMLPKELQNRPKKGFEVPLLKWFRNELKYLITDDLLSDQLIIEQGIFNLEYIRGLKHKLFSNNPGEVHAQIWGLIVFQYWWKKYIN